MKKLVAALCGMALLSVPGWAKTPPNYDAVQDLPPAKSAAFRQVDTPQGAKVAHRDSRTGAPTFVWMPRSTGGQLSARSALATMAPEEAARAQLETHASVLGVSSLEAAGLEVASVHQDKRGVRVVRMVQRSSGVEVFRQSLSLLLDRDNALVAVSGAISPHAAPTLSAERLPFRLSAQEAISAAFGDLTGQPLDPGVLSAAATEADPGPYQHFKLASFARPLGQELVTPARAKPVLYPMPDTLVPAYYLELNTGDADSTDSDYYGYVISALDGRLLMRHNLTSDAEYSYRVYADTTPPYTPWDGPSGTDATPHPTGSQDNFRLPFRAPNLVTLQNVPYTLNDPWLPDGAIVTTGNNVDAYADLVPPDNYNPGDLRPTVTAPGVFDRTLLFDIAPNANAEQIAAATTSLFYVTNWLHDWFYDTGFNEAAGNAQTNNYGRGGLQGDAMRAQAQDYSGTNNATMTVTSDGVSPRMQMYLFTGARNARLTVLAPLAVAGDYPAGVAAGFGPQTFDLNGDVVLALDAEDAAGPTSTDACSPLTNAAEVAGKIAFVDRGSCNFTVKVQNAEAAGAVGVIIADNAPGFITDIGGDQAGINIPSLRLTLEQANLLRPHLGTVQVRMWRGPTIGIDGTVDNQIVAHEWGHYLSGRLVQNGTGLVNNQGRAMGEGWGDFVALLMTVRPEDINVPSNANWSGVYAMAEHATRGISADSTFFGIRRVPYSVDDTKNALRFRHIMDGVALPTSAPLAPNGNPNAQVHNSGEVWASALWECYVSLLRAHPFQEAQDRMKSYLVNGLKLTPTAPTFLEARDALLAAAAANDPADFQRLWAAFARRGMGVGAVAPDRYSTTHAGVVESYQVGVSLQIVNVAYQDGISGDADGILDNGETGAIAITVKNTGSAPASTASATVVSTTSGVTVGDRGVGNFPSIPTNGEQTITIPVSLAGASVAQRLDFTIAVRDDSQVVPGDLSTSLSFKANYDEVTEATSVETVEASAANLPWVTNRDVSLANGAFQIVEFDDLNRTFYVQDLGAPSDIRLVTPELHVSTTQPFSVTFLHAHALEADVSGAYDGAVIELTEDGGATWVDVGTGLYNGVLENYAGNLNPLAGRSAIVGSTPNFPALHPVRIDLGTAFAGKTVQLRFRMGSDNAVGATGWLIDDLAFSGITNTPFTAICNDNGVCQNLPPVALAGPDLVVDERSTVSLKGYAYDPNGQALSVAWTRVSGPAVTLSGASTLTPTFTAPEVAADSQLVLRLSVTDGIVVSTDTVNVTIRQVNRVPVVNAGVDLVVNEREPVTLTGTATDPDGETLTYVWTQTAGTAVALLNGNTPAVGFTAPETVLGETLTFRLSVSDGKASVSDTVSVQVQNVNRAPQVTATSATVDERSTVTLSASAVDPDGDSLTWAWTQMSGTDVVLQGADTASPQFEAPEVTITSQLSFEVAVSDGDLTTVQLVTVDVRDVNRAPSVNAGVDQVAAERTEVELIGTALDADGDTLTWTWVQVAGTPVALSGADSDTVRFVTPDTNGGETLTFRLTVSDGALISSDTVDVVVSDQNRAPVVIADDVVANELSTATLVAVAADPDGDALTFTWEQLSGPEVTLEGEGAEVSFATGSVSGDTVFTFRVTVSDGEATASAEVSVTVRNVNQAPVANAGADVSVEGRSTVTLDGSGSDPDGDAIGFGWTQVGGPWVSLSNPTTARPNFTAPDVSEETRLVFALKVSDGALTAVDTVEVTVTPAEPQGGCSATGLGAPASAVMLLLAGLLRRRRS